MKEMEMGGMRFWFGPAIQRVSAGSRPHWIVVDGERSIRCKTLREAKALVAEIMDAALAEQTAADSADDFRQIVEAFRATAQRLGVRIKNRRAMRFKIVDSSGEHSVNIDNLAKQLRQHEPEAWDQVIETFLRGVASASAHVEETLALTEQPFAKIKELLMPCLKSNAPGGGIWSHELAPDLTILMAIDTPQHMLFVREEMIDESGHSDEEWLEQAKRNLVARTPAQWYDIVFKRPYELRQTITEDCYDSARCLVLDRLLPQETRYGWIVAPFSRDKMALTPNRYRRRDQIIEDLADKVAERIEQIPYPISHRIYIVKDGEWITKPMILGPNNTPVFIQVNAPGFSDEGD
jgi:hypothetical protein